MFGSGGCHEALEELYSWLNTYPVYRSYCSEVSAGSKESFRKTGTLVSNPHTLSHYPIDKLLFIVADELKAKIQNSQRLDENIQRAVSQGR